MPGRAPFTPWTHWPAGETHRTAQPLRLFAPGADERELDAAVTKINDLAITGIITADQAAQALKLVAAGGGNLVAAAEVTSSRPAAVTSSPPVVEISSRRTAPA